jgi:hypothetical protein
MMGADSRVADLSSGMMLFLVCGLGSDCQRFREGCCNVLLSLGIDATYDLHHIANRANLMPGHRRRLEDLIDGLDEGPLDSANPIPGFFRAFLALVKTSFDDLEVIRVVSLVADLFGRPIVACVLMDELCDHCRDVKYASRLIDAIASIRDALSPRHHEFLRQIALYGPRSVEWRIKKLLGSMGELPPDSCELTQDDSDAGCQCLKLLEWLEREAVVGPDTRVTNPDWIWLRNFRYRPQIVNHGPVLAYCRS